MIKIKFCKEFYTVILGFLMSLKFLFYFVCPVQGVPSISLVSGTIIKAKSITISGSGFGTKAQAAPLKYDDFELDDNNHEHSDKIYDGDWYLRTPATCITKYWITNPRTGSTKHVIADYDNIWPENAQQGSFRYSHGATLSPLYITAWMRWNHTFSDSLDQCKWLYVVPTYGFPTNEPKILNIMQWGDGVNPPTWAVNGLPEMGDYFHPGNMGAPIENIWIRMEWYYKESEPFGTANGIIKIWRQQGVGSTFVLETNDTVAITNNPEGTQHWNDVVFCDYGRAMDHEIEIDDIYIDNTPQRVEIGDNANWNDCTHREIQIPSVWSDNSITINVNHGSFQEGETVYLFVVDENGIASVGYPLLFGLGDLNNDEKVNIQDVQLCMNVVLGTETDTDIISRADVDNDGDVDEGDIEEIVNAILGE